LLGFRLYLRIFPYFYGLKEVEPDLAAGLKKEGQLKERSEGDQAQWQTALGEVLAAGS